MHNACTCPVCDLVNSGFLATSHISMLSPRRAHSQTSMCGVTAVGKKEKSDKKDKEKKDDDDDEPTTKKIRLVSPIANPLADKKLTKKVLKTIKKAAKGKHIKRGVKEVVKAIKKGEKGVAIIAGDISPIEVIAHVPILCEEMNMPYIYVPSKEDLGTASQTKRPTSIVMMSCKPDSDFKEAYDELSKELMTLLPKF